jgi:DNA modification methylase
MTVRLLVGHVLSVLAGEPAGHYHTVVTSPPYWQLRAYATEPQVWDAASPGEAWGCEHVWAVEQTRTEKGPDGPEVEVPTAWVCAVCGAWRGELGQEPSPELFVAHLVAVMEAVKRVLRDDGTLWVNLGGCYWNNPGGQNGSSRREGGFRGISNKAVEANREAGRQDRTGRGHPFLKKLDYVDVPGLFARAMQEAGWIWRSEVVWVKTSPLPESVSGTRFERCRVRVSQAERSQQPAKMAGGGVRPQSGVLNGDAPGAEWADCPGCPRCAANQGYVLRRGNGRPTKSTEAVLLFAKKPGYFFDQEAVREPHEMQPQRRLTPRHSARDAAMAALRPDKVYPYRLRDVPGVEGNPAGRNLRDWWVLSPEPLAAAHYAAYPTTLPARCIKAGTSEWGCCPACGAAWARAVDAAPEYRALLSHRPYEQAFDLEAFRTYLRDCREAQGLSRAEVDEALGTNTAYAWWEGRNYLGAFRQRVPSPDLYERLKTVLRMDDRFDAAHERYLVSESTAWNSGRETMTLGKRAAPAAVREVRTLGWRPTCRCAGAAAGAPLPCRVLDPFGGSGSTGLAANRLGRDCTLIELKSEYADLARRRLGREPLSLFAQGPLGGQVEEGRG